MINFPLFTYAVSLSFGIGLVCGIIIFVVFEAVDFFKEKN